MESLLWFIMGLSHSPKQWEMSILQKAGIPGQLLRHSLGFLQGMLNEGLQKGIFLHWCFSLRKDLC